MHSTNEHGAARSRSLSIIFSDLLSCVSNNYLSGEAIHAGAGHNYSGAGRLFSIFSSPVAPERTYFRAFRALLFANSAKTERSIRVSGVAVPLETACVNAAKRKPPFSVNRTIKNSHQVNCSSVLLCNH